MLIGIGMILCFVGGTFFGMYLRPAKPEVKPQEDGRAADFARQWHNIMTYDGTERGQIGDDWDA